MCVLENEDESLYPIPASAVVQAVGSAGAILMEDLTGNTHTDHDQETLLWSWSWSCPVLCATPNLVSLSSRATCAAGELVSLDIL